MAAPIKGSAGGRGRPFPLQGQSDAFLQQAKGPVASEAYPSCEPRRRGARAPAPSCNGVRGSNRAFGLCARIGSRQAPAPVVRRGSVRSMRGEVARVSRFSFPPRRRSPTTWRPSTAQSEVGFRIPDFPPAASIAAAARRCRSAPIGPDTEPHAQHRQDQEPIQRELRYGPSRAPIRTKAFGQGL